MNKREAKFGILFRHWIKRFNLVFTAAAFELKQTTGSSIPFNCLPDHQIEALQAAAGRKGLLYKAPDDSRGIKPFDYFFLRRSDGYVVIKYPKRFFLIRVQDFLDEKKKSKRKSLTEKRAKEISVWAVNC